MGFTKTQTAVKLFFGVSFTGLFLYFILAFYGLHTSYLSSPVKRTTRINDNTVDYGLDTIEARFDDDLKYILMYTKKGTPVFYKEGQYHFVKQQCLFSNCYITTDIHLRNGDMRNFDAVVINVTDLSHVRLPKGPKFRTVRQKYVFYGMVPPDHAPVCRDDSDGYFNWTWSYKLYSDILSPFFIVKDMEKNIVAPSPDVIWSKRMKNSSIGNDVILKLKSKSKAVAMFVKKCNEQYGKIYTKKMREALQTYSLELDLFGCDHYCINDTVMGCDAIIERDYYFVMVQERVLAEDFLTDIVLKAYLNHAVPIVKSGAELDKFLPPGSYINAHLNNAFNVAALIHYIINNPEIYYSYFRWKNFYTFHESQEFEGVCQICTLLNDERWMNDHRSYRTFRKWWYTGPLEAACFKNVTWKPKPTHVKSWF